ncbi:MAG: hypothetical protein XD49_2131 [Caldanaerobacter subterraneus]|jgi:archaellum component FlaC|nr:hypothetical protein [Caldanaerobacter subterraneus]KUK07824.1 MAG: hypothetical protein XD49_2131 [Caldanaerobacter subterraneus]MDI3518268.1 hypothetical protein [Caldanaerobacter sp.]
MINLVKDFCAGVMKMTYEEFMNFIVDKFNSSEKRFDNFKKRLDGFEERFDVFEKRLEKRLDGIEKRLENVEKRLESVESLVKATFEQTASNSEAITEIKIKILPS